MEMPETELTATQRPVWNAGRTVPEPACRHGSNAGAARWTAHSISQAI